MYLDYSVLRIIGSCELIEPIVMSSEEIEDWHKKNKIVEINPEIEPLHRSSAFGILGNVAKLAFHLERTKFCSNMIRSGYCTRSNCRFAHTLEEYTPPQCVFQNECDHPMCKFLHPDETMDSYKKRIKFEPPVNIL